MIATDELRQRHKNGSVTQVDEDLITTSEEREWKECSSLPKKTKKCKKRNADAKAITATTKTTAKSETAPAAKAPKKCNSTREVPSSDKTYVRLNSKLSLISPEPLSLEPETTVVMSANNCNPNHPPGYNKRKRDIVKLVLVAVAAALVRGDAAVATTMSIVAIVCLKEGTFWSTRNLKWMALCIISFGMSLASWTLERGSHEQEEDKLYATSSVYWMSAKTIQFCWAMTLRVFLVSAYVHGHNSLLEFEFLHIPNETGGAKLPKNLPPSGPRRDPPPKTYLLY